MKLIQAGVLNVAYLEVGPTAGQPVILLHGFPYDVHSYDEVAERLGMAGRRCIIPFLRGYGPTRFIDPATPRSGEQAALGADLLALMDALALPSAIVAGYDWGGRAACVVAALWPERVKGLVSGGDGYNIQDIANSGKPAEAEHEYRLWYQYYFQTERGRAGLSGDRGGLCRLLWRLWSPTWQFDEATFAQTSEAFDNPDFVDVVIHSYRHRFINLPGDPAYAGFERQLAARPKITVPTIALHGDVDGVAPLGPDKTASQFIGAYERRIVPNVGHNVPQEAPAAFAEAILALG